MSSHSVVGAFSPGENAVSGLANDGTSTTYAVDGTEIFIVTTATGALIAAVQLWRAGARSALRQWHGVHRRRPVWCRFLSLSTWAMMLVGFAGLGYAGYRKRKIKNERTAFA